MAQVPVVNFKGEHLAPCHPARARQLLRNGRARVVQDVTPYTIQLIPKDADTHNGTPEHRTEEDAS